MVRHALIAFVMTAALAGTASAAPLPVIVSILPHAGLAAAIGGDLVDVHVLVGPGQSPQTYDPTPRELTALQGARVWLRAGVPMENTLAGRIARLFPNLEVVDLREGCTLITDDDHAHGEADPHIWLSPLPCAHQAATIAATLTRLDPAHADTYRERGLAVRDSLVAVDRELRVQLAPVQGRTLVVFHPAFAYLCRDYGLHELPIETGGLEPSPRHLASVLATVRRQGARAIFVQPQFAATSARTVAEDADLEVITVDPLARDVVANLRRIAAAIARGLAKEAP